MSVTYEPADVIIHRISEQAYADAEQLYGLHTDASVASRQVGLLRSALRIACIQRDEMAAALERRKQERQVQ